MRDPANPRPNDFFPVLRRVHGTTHPSARFADWTRPDEGRKLRNANPCVNEACAMNHSKGGEAHDDQAANVQDWKDEHRFRKDAPLESCHSRELAR